MIYDVFLIFHLIIININITYISLLLAYVVHIVWYDFWCS